MPKLVNRARMDTATTGTGTITLGSAVAPFQSFADAGVANGESVHYVIEDGSAWEIGTGTYTASGTTLTRTVIESTNSDAAIDLSGAAQVFVDANARDFFPVGTAMLFVQTTAPTGWTKSATHNDKALRIVSGTASSGGSVAFSTVFARTATDSHTLTINQIPAHAHDVIFEVQSLALGAGTTVSLGTPPPNDFTRASQSAGGGTGHTHNMDIRVQYVDAIIATKD